MEEIMLTTVDNPFDPFTEFDQWYNYDMEKGYNCCGYLAKMAQTSTQFTEDENAEIIEEAINNIVRNYSLGIFMKAVKGKPNGTLHLNKK